MSDLKCKRIYEEQAEADGIRILVDRLWPRGVKGDAAGIDLWARDIAPSNELRRWFSHDLDRFTEFSTLYFAELDANPESAHFLETIMGRLSKGNVTLLYAARDELHNHAIVLKEWIELKFSNPEKRLQRLQQTDACTGYACCFL